MEKVYHATGNWTKVEIAIVNSDKADFKPKLIKIDKEGQYIY